MTWLLVRNGEDCSDASSGILAAEVAPIFLTQSDRPDGILGRVIPQLQIG